jgi:hypothetical protein
MAVIATFHRSGKGSNSISISSDDKSVVFTSSSSAVIQDISNLEKGNAFEIACQRLGNDTSLDDIEKRYGLKGLVPICGANAPLKVDLMDTVD